MVEAVGVPVAAEKMAKLTAIFGRYKSALVAFSGGVDSSLLLLLAKQVLGQRVLAVTVRSVGVPQEEAKMAGDFTQQLGVRHMLVDADVLSVPDYAQNTPQRCYACKLHVFGRLQAIALEKGFDVVMDGTNADDVGDYRPGLVAARELGVCSPLQEAGITKAEVRALLKYYHISNWDKPAAPCLATRFPYGATVTAEGLRQVWLAEKHLHESGFRQVRVRHHGSVARIEVPESEMAALLAQADTVCQYLKEAVGFHYVTLDLQGFRSGSMNETLPRG